MPVLTVHMPSDHDDETVSSSDSGRASPAPATVGKRNGGAAAAGKGILVHSNKKSANTNRVSFVTGNGGSSAPPPSVRRSKKNDKPRPTAATDNQSFGGGDDGDGGRTPYYARTGRRLTGFGVKSHLHEFYDNPDRGGDTRQDDDFKYCVEPQIRWRKHCCGAYAVLGLAIMSIGAATMAAGHLIPAKDPVVGRSANMEVIDRWAVAYNENLASCRYVGSAVFAVGVVFTVVRFWISVMRSGGGVCGDDDDKTAAEKKLATDRRLPCDEHQTVRIPITGSVQNVQPDPRSIDLQYASDS